MQCDMKEVGESPYGKRLSGMRQKETCKAKKVSSDSC